MGNPLLRETASEFSKEEILHEDTNELLFDMWETLDFAGGIGLAAPQIGVSKQLAVIKLSEDYNLDLLNFDLITTIKRIIRDKIYKKDKSIMDIIYSFIELYFRNNISIKNISLLKSYHYFLEKINNTKVYNLDEETVLMEFEDKILNG